MRTTTISALLGLAGAFALWGCSVPQAALDQANNAANLTQEMHGQVAHLEEVQQTVSDIRRAEIRELLARKTKLERKLADTQDIDDSPEAGLFQSLRALSDARAKRTAESDATLAELDDKLAKLLTAVPNTDKALASVQKELNALGLQRNSEERRKLAIAYLTAIRSDWDAAKLPTVPTGAASAAVVAAAPASAASAPAATPAAPSAASGPAQAASKPN